MFPESTLRRTRFLQVALRSVDLKLGKTTVLRDIRWKIRPGERWVLIGGNGAGKTQLLKLIAGDVWPTPTGRALRRYVRSGERFDQPEGVKDTIAYLGPERQDRYERYGWNFTAAAIVGTGIHRSDIPLDRPTAADRRRIGVLLHRMRITRLARRRFLTLSYGERRLVLLARALAWQPSLLLLDEVVNGLDSDHRDRLMRFLASTRRSTLPWVLTTHRIEDVPASATHVAILRGGRIVYRGKLTTSALRKAFGNVRPAGAQVRSQTARALRNAAGVPAPLVSLRRASVYVDGVRVLSGLGFTIREGECWVVHGANGAGKSTLLRTIYGDYPVAVGGRISRAGIEPGVPLAEFRAWVGYVTPQLQADHPQYLNVQDAVGSGLHASIGLNDALTDDEARRARRALADFGLTGLSRHSLRALSYGQLRRVLFARAWVTRPRLLLLDEPYAGVDTPTRAALVSRLDALLRRGLTAVMATHHRAEWPAGATHELQLQGGRSVYCGPVRR